ncbi:MAG: AraC family transcriptional regulator [Verrucomicrobiaceae bacterium]|nr:AraC family transcriptional regulator [Verrucomicrobiaceae bacterium]
MTQPLELTADGWRGIQNEWMWVYCGPVPVCGVWSAEIPVPAGVFFVERGEGRIQADGQEVLVKRGEAFLSAPGPRKHWFKPGTRLLSVGFRVQWPDGRAVFKSGLNVVAKSRKLRTATQRLFLAVHRGRKSVTFREAVKPVSRCLADWADREAAFQDWFAVWCEVMEVMGVKPEPRSARIRSSRLDKLVRWLDSLPLSRLAPDLPPHFDLGQRRADQLLQQHLGTTLRGYLEKRRLQAACELVEADGDTMKQIAYELGFRHASHFTAWFRRQVGVSPSVYRSNGADAA